MNRFQNAPVGALPPSLEIVKGRLRPRILAFLTFLAFAFPAPPLPAPLAQAQPTRAAGGNDEHDEHTAERAVMMTAAEREAQGVLTAAAGPRTLARTLSAPGEVRTDAYRSSQVTPRISAQIVERHARLGDKVEAGQPLVTLSSVRMAEAQGTLIEAEREWQRVEALGRDVVSEQRYIAAQVARQRSYATVRAYGMTAEQTARLLDGGDASLATGEFGLLSPQAGTVIHDDFVVGEVVEPGRLLFEISDESVLWVEAQVAPEEATGIRVGAPARVGVGAEWLGGKVVQLHHAVAEATRTRGIRVEVENTGDVLHAGDYVEVSLQTGATDARVAVPADAVLLMDGAPTVFEVEGDALRPRPVETGVTSSGWTEIEAGLAPGQEVVTRGAFLIKSLLLKSQLGEGHAH
jgi:cobalt-zinc-cadmium efflux system membrane fusion protein